MPVVEVNHPLAHITHEAAIGSVDSKQLQTLMSRGLDEDEATDLIIEGLAGLTDMTAIRGASSDAAQYGAVALAGSNANPTHAPARLAAATAGWSMSAPDIDDWICDVKSQPGSAAIGMILAHKGIVRGTSRSGEPVTGMSLTADLTRFEEALAEAGTWPGIFAVRGWVNQGELSVGDDIMRLVVAGDIREHVFEGLQRLVSLIKTEVVGESELA